MWGQEPVQHLGSGCDVICALYVQVIKAAIAQVKTIADGGVTAADLTQAK